MYMSPCVFPGWILFSVSLFGFFLLTLLCDCPATELKGAFSVISVCLKTLHLGPHPAFSTTKDAYDCNITQC